MVDVAEIKAAMAKQHAEIGDKLIFLFTTIQRLLKQTPSVSKSNEPYILSSKYKKCEEESTADNAVATEPLGTPIKMVLAEGLLGWCLV